MRDSLDRYYTPTLGLLPLVPWWEKFLGQPLVGTFCEPCIGLGAIAHHIRSTTPLTLEWANDIDEDTPVESHRDASLPYLWEDEAPIDYVITNPPYGALAAPILTQAIANSKLAVAVLVRLTFLERCVDRNELPDPSIVLVLPRLNWGVHDSGDKVTHCWVVFDKRMTTQHFKSLSKTKLLPADF